jgi:hypothetical protein
MSDIKVRVGQQNTIKVVSSVSGSAGGSAVTAENVIGGIASVTSLSVSGVSTFVGIGTFSGDLYVGGDLYVADDLVFDEFTARNINLSGIGTISTLDTTNGTIDFLFGTNISYSGIGTIETLDVTTGTIDYLTNTNLNTSGIGTIETLDATTGTIDFLSNTNLNTSGIGTIETLDATTGTIDFLSNTNLNTSGIGTIETLDTTTGTIDYLNGINVSYSGIATLGVTSISQIYVSGVSTFVGVATFKNNVYIDGDLYVSDDLVFDEFTVRNGNISEILTVGQSIRYTVGQPYGVVYFDLNDQLVSTGTTSLAISETNYILTTDNSGIPTWSSVIDGGTY